MSHRQSNCLLQDDRGYLWVGTDNGLNRFDGYSFTVFRNDLVDSTSIGGNEITAICQDSGRSIWICTASNGISRYLPESRSFRRYVHDPSDPTSIGSNQATAAFVDRHGTVWFGAGGLNGYDRRTDSFIRFVNRPDDSTSISSDEVSFILEDRDGIMWVGTSSGLDLFDRNSGTFRHFLPPRVRGGPFRLTEAVDDDSVLWIGSMGGGLLRFDKRTTSVKSFRHAPRLRYSLGNDNVSALAQDRKGRLWIGTWDRAGLHVFDPSRSGPPVFHRYFRDPRQPTGLSENRILDIAEDRNGNMWIATHNGLNRVRATWKFHRDLDGEQVTDIVVDRMGRLWCSTMGSGIYVLDGRSGVQRRIEPIPAGESQKAVYFNCLFTDRNGIIWAGAYKQGIFRIDPMSFASAYFPFERGGLPKPEFIKRILESDDKTIWTDTDVGLFALNVRGRFAPYAHPHDAAVGDQRGKAWLFASTGFGAWDGLPILKDNWPYDPAIFPDDRRRGVVDVVADHPDSIWVLIDYWGVVRVDIRNGRCRLALDRTQLPHPSAAAMVRDEAGRLWISTIDGLVRYEPETGTRRVFTVRDGLPSNTFYSAHGLFGPDGKIWFGTTNGLVGFEPAELDPAPRPPDVVLTGFFALHRPVTTESDISVARDFEITFRENVFSFEAAVLDLTRPEDNQFQYYMEGFDQGWVTAGPRRAFTYTNLNPGSYVLHVRGSNSDGTWSQENLAVRLTITPPFWFRWWFLSGVAALIAGGVIYLHRWRLERRKELERTRDRIARDLHDDVASTLGSIALYSVALRKEVGSDHRDADDLLERIGRLSSEAVDTLGDIVWSVAPEHDEPGDFLSHIRDHLSQTCTTNGLRYDLTIDESGKTSELEQMARKNLYLIYKEALRNVLRHSAASTVWVRIESTHGDLVITIRDDGRGFTSNSSELSIGHGSIAPSPRRGHGLRNMKRRAVEVGARLKVESAPESGTTVTVRLKMT